MRIATRSRAWHTGGVLAAAALLVAPEAAAHRGELEWWTRPPAVKVRPGEPALPPGPVELAAARNEFEPFQLVLRARTRPVRRVDVTAGDLAGAGRHRIPARYARVYLEGMVRITTPSSIEGSSGEWPDPLLPRVDAYAGERRSAFPFDLEPGRSQPLWIEVFVPPGTPPGRYRGALEVTVGGEPAATVPWSVEVWPFTLPATSSLPTSYGFSGLSALDEHFGRYTGEDDLASLTRLYTRAALVHRLSLHGGTMAPPPATFPNGAARIDWRAYDREVGPALDGTLLGRDEPLAGARATSIDLRTPGDLSDAERVAYWRAWAEHFREHGWLDRLFVYLWDEPAPENYAEIVRTASLVRRADRRIRTLLTEPLAPELAEAVDVWVPLVNCLEPRGRDTCGQTVVPRRAYAAVEKRGARLWWYQSCASHGCGVVGGEAYTGWPSYVIDAPPAAHRIFPWIAFRDGIEGELYYNTVETFGRDGGPWSRVLAHGGNGDGTLFYPGTPGRLGGASHFPVESLRLKLIREGLEDYEYLTLLAAAGGRDVARKWARAVAEGPGWGERAQALAEARAAIGRRLAEREGGGGAR